MEDAEKRRKRHARYNKSAKGQKRNKKYEKAHPERKVRWASNQPRSDREG